ncbi:hypothetical protein FB45DRAFT_1064505 [Roridomyces roridus]|uniref:BTB domain-containing protein n=1 Tax=Roridomyces roridus TaxID=1738132 RepID=A0AAD7B9N1_9AGAR|nr:hypothetical protein FB45DRAFT_1064505 [Roridomyces roridus]
MDGESSPVVRSSELWFDDGTVILQAENTLFRAYRGVLSAQSPVFRDTFSLPQPKEQETFDGCPLLHVHDSAADFEIFLSALHDAGYFANYPVDGFETLTRLLRLATKYDVEHLRARMVSILDAIYPSSLTEWLVRSPPAGYTQMEGDDFLALDLASEYQLLPPLPGIYFECSAYTIPNIFASGIDLKTKETCVAVEGEFSDKWARKIVHGVLCPSETNACNDPTSCDRVRLGLVSQNGLPKLAELFDCSWRWDRSTLCVQCKATAQKEYDSAVRKLWDVLPSLFGLPEWEVLLGTESG